MKDEWLNSIRERMDSYEESAPEGLWSDIEASVFPAKKSRKAAFMPWLWRSVAAAAAVVAAVLIVNNVTPKDPEKDRVASQTDNQPSSSVNQGDSPVPSGDLGDLIAMADVEAPPAAQPIRRPIVVRQERLATETVTEIIAQQEPEPAVEIPEPFVPEEPEVTEPQVVDDRVATIHDGEDWSGYMSATDDGASDLLSKVSMKASLSGTATESRDVSNYNPTMFYYGAGPTRAAAPAPPLAYASEVKSQTVHHRPVRMSLMFHIPLGKVFGAEAGLSYTTLHSTFSTSSGSTFSQDTQTLRYAGIPLDLTANIFGNDWCRLYLSAGGAVEKCVSGKVVNTVQISGQASGEGTVTDLSVKPLLWSLNAGAGVQVNIGKNLGLYVEPGMSYHFDDGSSVQTVYKDKPLDFMMTVGARVSFR